MKRRLNKRGKIALVILSTIILCFILKFMINNLQEQARECDRAKGAICTLDEIVYFERSIK